MLEYFCDIGANLSCQNGKGQTPLMFAAKNEYLDIVNYLSIRAKNINVEDDEGQTLLTIFIQKGQKKIIRKLLGRGANINFRNREGKTALYLAVENNMEIPMVKYLLKKGANPHIQDNRELDVCCIAGEQYQQMPEFFDCPVKLSLSMKALEQKDKLLPTAFSSKRRKAFQSSSHQLRSSLRRSDLNLKVKDIVQEMEIESMRLDSIDFEYERKQSVKYQKFWAERILLQEYQIILPPIGQSSLNLKVSQSSLYEKSLSNSDEQNPEQITRVFKVFKMKILSLKSTPSQEKSKLFKNTLYKFAKVCNFQIPSQSNQESLIFQGQSHKCFSDLNCIPPKIKNCDEMPQTPSKRMSLDDMRFENTLALPKAHRTKAVSMMPSRRLNILMAPSIEIEELSSPKRISTKAKSTILQEEPFQPLRKRSVSRDDLFQEVKPAVKAKKLRRVKYKVEKVKRLQKNVFVKYKIKQLVVFKQKKKIEINEILPEEHEFEDEVQKCLMKLSRQKRIEYLIKTGKQKESISQLEFCTRKNKTFLLKREHKVSPQLQDLEIKNKKVHKCFQKVKYERQLYNAQINELEKKDASFLAPPPEKRASVSIKPFSFANIESHENLSPKHIFGKTSDISLHQKNMFKIQSFKKSDGSEPYTSSNKESSIKESLADINEQMSNFLFSPKIVQPMPQLDNGQFSFNLTPTQLQGVIKEENEHSQISCEEEKLSTNRIVSKRKKSSENSFASIKGYTALMIIGRTSQSKKEQQRPLQVEEKQNKNLLGIINHSKDPLFVKRNSSNKNLNQAEFSSKDEMNKSQNISERDQKKRIHSLVSEQLKVPYIQYLKTKNRCTEKISGVQDEYKEESDRDGSKSNEQTTTYKVYSSIPSISMSGFQNTGYEQVKEFKPQQEIVIEEQKEDYKQDTPEKPDDENQNLYELQAPYSSHPELEQKAKEKAQMQNQRATRVHPSILKDMKRNYEAILEGIQQKKILFSQPYSQEPSPRHFSGFNNKPVLIQRRKIIRTSQTPSKGQMKQVRNQQNQNLSAQMRAILEKTQEHEAQYQQWLSKVADSRRSREPMMERKLINNKFSHFRHRSTFQKQHPSIQEYSPLRTNNNTFFAPIYETSHQTLQSPNQQQQEFQTLYSLQGNNLRTIKHIYTSSTARSSKQEFRPAKVVQQLQQQKGELQTLARERHSKVRDTGSFDSKGNMNPLGVMTVRDLDDAIHQVLQKKRELSYKNAHLRCN